MAKLTAGYAQAQPLRSWWQLLANENDIKFVSFLGGVV
jgi:hypothetical protein